MHLLNYDEYWHVFDREGFARVRPVLPSLQVASSSAMPG